MKVPPVRVVGFVSFSVSRWIVWISSAVRSLQASTAPLFEDATFAFKGEAAFIFVTAGDEFDGAASGNVCVCDDGSLQPTTSEASRTASVYNCRCRLIGINCLSRSAQIKL